MSDSIHEAAHAVFAYRFGFEVKSITLKPPMVWVEPPFHSVTFAQYLEFLLAGVVAEKVLADVDPGLQSDMLDALNFLEAIGYDPKTAEATVVKYIDIITPQVVNYEKAIRQLADLLDERGKLAESDLIEEMGWSPPDNGIPAHGPAPATLRGIVDRDHPPEVRLAAHMINRRTRDPVAAEAVKRAIG